ncbi:MAG TPA: ATP-binding protein, partial [Candidatus Hydrogenedentes bacterium]|nr:ATP-binding protein [Candidatus Hydrogenedentota bacterium]
ARREPERAMEPVDLNKVLRSAAFLTRKMVKESTDHFSMRLQKDIPPVAGNFQRLEQVFVNLIINACQALPNRGSRLNVASGYDEAKKCIAIKIRDEGSGILEKDLPRIFDPFFTTRADGGGTGLGLAISQSILNEHGATIRFRSTPNRGTTVSVLFPVIETGRKVVGAATSDSEALNERKSAVTNRQAVL